MNQFFTPIVAGVLALGCAKKESDISYPDAQFKEPHYDTTAVDSFSAGATSVDVMRKIKMSSQSYQDSVQQALKKEIELKKKQALEEKLKKEVEKSIKMDEKPVEASPEKQP